MIMHMIWVAYLWENIKLRWNRVEQKAFALVSFLDISREIKTANLYSLRMNYDHGVSIQCRVYKRICFCMVYDRKNALYVQEGFE